MAKITYLDPTDDASKVTWMGVAFTAHKPVEVPDTHPIVEAAKTHPYFKLEQPKAASKKAEPEPSRKAEPEPDEGEAEGEEAGKPHWDEDASSAAKPPKHKSRHKKADW